MKESRHIVAYIRVVLIYQRAKKSIKDRLVVGVLDFNTTSFHHMIYPPLIQQHALLRSWFMRVGFIGG
jgi:hypothetical protein